jgi:hypothetical protein
MRPGQQLKSFTLGILSWRMGTEGAHGVGVDAEVRLVGG